MSACARTFVYEVGPRKKDADKNLGVMSRERLDSILESAKKYFPSEDKKDK